MPKLVAELQSATLDKDNFPYMDSERRVAVGLAKRAKARIEELEATLELTREFIKGEMIAHAVVKHGRTQLSLLNVIDAALKEE